MNNYSLNGVNFNGRKECERLALLGYIILIDLVGRIPLLISVKLDEKILS